MSYFELLQYQKDGVEQILRFGDVLLSDHCGAGKSAQVVEAAKRLNVKSVLILCPASLRSNWIREFNKWWTDCPLIPLPIFTGKDQIPESANLLTCSYELAAKHSTLSQLITRRFDLLVMDESHTALRNPESKKCQAVLTHIWPLAKKRIAVTGTPMPNGRAIEVQPLFAAIAPQIFGNFAAYTKRYCYGVETDYGLRYLGSKNLPELGRIAREHFMIRRSKEETLGQLPPLVRQEVPLAIPPATVKRWLKKHCPDFDPAIVNSLIRRIEAGEPLALPSDGPVSTARRQIGVLKAGPSADFIGDLLAEGPNSSAVVFAHHKEVISQLAENFDRKGISFVLVDGSTPPEVRQAAVDAFQAGKVTIFLASILAANTGITLTRSSTVVIVEPDWVPTNNEQAEGRCHRMTQTSLTRVFYLVVPDSLDDAVTTAVVKKQKNIAKALDVTSTAPASGEPPVGSQLTLNGVAA
jgi:SWI/SNF-related matrix-associated actin-dependent regulator 1 of chromatin subfamily A